MSTDPDEHNTPVLGPITGRAPTGALRRAIESDEAGQRGADGFKAVLLIRACSELMDSIALGADFDEVGRVAARWAQTLLGAQGASVTRVDGAEVTYVAAVGKAVAVLGRTQPRAGSFTGDVLAAGQARIFNPVDAGAASRERAEQDRILSGIVAPILTDAGPVGTLGVISSVPLRFGARDLATMQALADFLALCLDRLAARKLRLP